MAATTAVPWSIGCEIVPTQGRTKARAKAKACTEAKAEKGLATTVVNRATIFATARRWGKERAKASMARDIARAVVNTARDTVSTVSQTAGITITTATLTIHGQNQFGMQRRRFAV